MSEEVLLHYYASNKNALINKATRRLFDAQAAEDVVHDAFVKALEYIETYDEKKAFPVWFNAILNNCIKDARTAFLKDKAGSSHNDNEPFDEDDFPVDDGGLSTDHVLWDKVKTEIESRAYPLQTVLRLYFIEDYQPKDIKYLVGDAYKDVSSIRASIYRFSQEMKEKYG